MNTQELIQQHLAKPIEKGDLVYVRGLGSQNKQAFTGVAEVTQVRKGEFQIIEHKSPKWYPLSDAKPYTNNIGVNPFPETRDRVQNVTFTLESILFNLGITREKEEKYTTKSGITIKNLNWNPFVLNSQGEKVYYQRDFVWPVENNQLLLESIYQNIDCGKILIRKRSWEEVEKQGEEAAFNDIVDGKQRLNAMSKFIYNEYPDSNGNYYQDLSVEAQRRLLNHQLFSYSELPEDIPDNQVLEQFLKLNFCGVPQSKEHIEFVKSIRL